MQVDHASSVEEKDMDIDDSESLFGSPPPSPGRSYSSGLALPGVGNVNIFENVGTIALPGSPSHSELSVNPPVSRLSGASRHENAQRPALAPRTQAPSRATMGAQRSSSGTPASIAKQKKKAAAKARAPLSRPTPPPIPMPEPGSRPPPNFLRNQQALLGLAGLVGQVNPANLNYSRPRSKPPGANTQCPIVVDGPSASQGGSSSLMPSSSKLPKPSGEAIVEALVKQKNILPVLTGLLNILTGSFTAFPTPSSSARSSPAPRPEPSPQNSDGPPPAKRKRLNKVPLGAEGWNIPFPFPEGEEPAGYRANWEQERGKRLITELIDLIKVAAHKAATKKHSLAKEESRGAARKREMHNVRSYYRPKTVYGSQTDASGSQPQARTQEQTNSTSRLQADTTQSRSQTPSQNQVQARADQLLLPDSTLTDVSNVDDSSRTPSRGLQPVAPTDPAVPFDQLIASLLPEDPLPSITSTSDVLWATSLEHTPSAEESLASIDDWVALLDTHFPLLEDDASNNHVSSGDDFSEMLALMDSQSSASYTSSIPHTPALNTTASSTPMPAEPLESQSAAHDAPDMLPDFLIDPFLLALSESTSDLSVEQQSQSQTQADFISQLEDSSTPSSMPSLAPSPFPSATSIASPLTPQMDSPFPAPEIQVGDEAPQGLASDSDTATTLAEILRKLASKPDDASSRSLSQPSSLDVAGVAQSLAPSMTLHSLPPSMVPPVAEPLASSSTSTNNPQYHMRRCIAGPGRPGGVGKAKDEILRRAREHRRQLVAEIEKSKVELWEMTLEQGVLTHLMKDSA